MPLCGPSGPSLLRIDCSARSTGSISRGLCDQIQAKLGGRVVVRDVGATPVPAVNNDWVGANFTPVDQRDGKAKAALALSDKLIAELKAADTIVIGLPIYNFGMPAALKAWFDLVIRSGETFGMGTAGPEGLLKGKRAIVAVASGMVKVGAENDFATPHLKMCLGFIGITDVTFISADATAIVGKDAQLEAAAAAIAALKPSAV